MNLKKSLPLVLAVVLGLVAMIMARRFLKPTVTTVKERGNTTPVVVTTHDVPPGRELTAEDLIVAEIPTNVLPTGSFPSVDKAMNRVATTSLVKGQLVLESLLSPEGQQPGISALIPPGMRAMTIGIDDITSVSGMVQPGYRVDIMAMVPDMSGHQSARTVLQNVKILATGKQIMSGGTEGAPPGPFSFITFLLTPENARLLELCSSTARPWLALRNGKDKEQLKNDVTYLEQLHGAGPDVLVAIAASQPTTKPTTLPTALASKGQQRRGIVPIQVIRDGVLSTILVRDPEAGGTGPDDEGADADSTSTGNKLASNHGGRPGAGGTAAANPNDRGAHARSTEGKNVPTGTHRQDVTGADAGQVLPDTVDPFGGRDK